MDKSCCSAKAQTFGDTSSVLEGERLFNCAVAGKAWHVMGAPLFFGWRGCGRAGERDAGRAKADERPWVGSAPAADGIIAIGCDM